MAKKTESKFVKVAVTKDANGDTDLVTFPDATPRALPELLKTPIPVDVDKYSDEYFRHAIAGGVAKIKFETEFHANLQREVEQRYQALLDLYAPKANDAVSWKRMAFDLARDFIPGLSIEYIYSKDAEPRVRTTAKMAATVAAVDTAREQLQQGRTSKVSDKMAIAKVYKNWPPELGKKPKNIEAFVTEYYRCKKQTRPMTLYQLTKGHYKTGN